MMFKTKERNIDKANMKIEVLEWQLKMLMETQGDVNNERDSALGDARRVQEELHEYKELESELEKEVDRLRVLLQERRELEFGLGGDERKRLRDELERSRSLLEKSQSYRVSNANEIKTLRDKLCQLQSDYDKVLDENRDIIQNRNSLLAGVPELKEEIKRFREIESHLSYVEMDIEKLENSLKRKNECAAAEVKNG